MEEDGSAWKPFKRSPAVDEELKLIMSNGGIDGAGGAGSGKNNVNLGDNGIVKNVFILPLHERVVFPHQRIGISLSQVHFRDLK